MADLNEIDGSQSSIADGTWKTYRLPWSKYDNIFKIIDLKKILKRIKNSMFVVNNIVLRPNYWQQTQGLVPIY